jgi:hypothetical protein
MTCSCRLNHAKSLDVYRPCYGSRLDLYLRFRCTKFGMEICDLQVSGIENSTHPVTSLTLSRFPASPPRAMEYFEKVCKVSSITSIRHGMARCYKGRNRIPLLGFSNGTERTYAWKSLQGFPSPIHYILSFSVQVPFLSTFTCSFLSSRYGWMEPYPHMRPQYETR